MQQRRTYLLNTEFLTSECAGAINQTWSEIACRRGDRSVDELMWIHDQLMYGSDYPFDLRPVLLDSKVQADLMLVDGCMGTARLKEEDERAAIANLGINAEATEIRSLLEGQAIVMSRLLNRDRCTRFYQGLLESGAHAGLIEFAGVSREILHERQYEIAVAPMPTETGSVPAQGAIAGINNTANATASGDDTARRLYQDSALAVSTWTNEAASGSGDHSNRDSRVLSDAVNYI